MKGKESGDILLTVAEKQRVIKQIEAYRQALLRDNKLRQTTRHTTVSIKDLRNDPIKGDSYFKLLEQNNEVRKLYKTLDPAVKIAINFLS